jgi:hypothetical protein
MAATSVLVCMNEYPDVILYLKEFFPGVYDIDKLSAFFLPSQFHGLRIYSILCTLLFISIAAFLVFKKSFIQDFSNTIKQDFFSLRSSLLLPLQSLSKKQQLIIGSVSAIILLHHLYLWNASPFRVDDANSYVFCAHQGPLATALFYHDVNNHIFYNLLCSLLDMLPLSPETVMLIPSSMSWILILGISFCYVLKRFDFNAALFTLVLNGSLPACTNYSVQGRGYMMMALFVFVTVLFTFEFCYYKKSKTYLLGIGLGAFLSVYTLLSALIVIVPLLFFLLIKSGKEYRLKTRYTFLFIGIALSVVYLPVLLINGLDRLQSPWVQPKGWTYFLSILQPSLLESIDYLLGVSGKGYMPLALLGLVGIVFIRKHSHASRWLVFFILLQIGTFLFLALRTNFPPYRTWTYLSFLFNISLGVILSLVFEKKIRPTIRSGIGCILLFLWGFHRYFSNDYIPEKNYFDEANRLSQQICETHPSNILVDRRDVLFYFMKLYAIKSNGEFKVIEKSHGEKMDYVLQYQENFPLTDKRHYSLWKQFYDCLIYKKSN